MVDAICDAIDKVFRADPAMAGRYPQAPAAKGEPTASLKSFVPDRPGHDRRYAIDCAKIERNLGYRAQVRDFAAGFATTLDWYLRNPDWWLDFKRT